MAASGEAFAPYRHKVGCGGISRRAGEGDHGPLPPSRTHPTLPHGNATGPIAAGGRRNATPAEGTERMKVGQAIAEIMKREGIEILCGYPVNHLLEFAAAADIRPIIVRQERIGLHMADAISRVTSGRKIGAFCMQHGPGAENAYGGVAQAYGESVPVLVIPQGYPRRIAHIDPNFNSSRAMRDVAKIAEPVNIPAELTNIMRRAFSNLRNGRSGPAIVEVPTDIWNEEI